MSPGPKPYSVSRRYGGRAPGGASAAPTAAAICVVFLRHALHTSPAAANCLFTQCSQGWRVASECVPCMDLKGTGRVGGNVFREPRVNRRAPSRRVASRERVAGLSRGRDRPPVRTPRFRPCERREKSKATMTTTPGAAAAPPPGAPAPPPSSTIVTLNVGGAEFATTVATLTKVRGGARGAPGPAFSFHTLRQSGGHVRRLGRPGPGAGPRPAAVRPDRFPFSSHSHAPSFPSPPLPSLALSHRTPLSSTPSSSSRTPTPCWPACLRATCPTAWTTR
jgi:hypothetical protein